MVKLKIFVIDDSEYLRGAMKKFFTNYDCEVFTFGNGLDGLKHAAVVMPDIIFLDIMMPVISGIDLLRCIKVIDQFKDIPVVIIAGINENSAIDKVMQLGAKRVLLKPIKRNEVFEVVDEILGNSTFSSQKIQKLFEKEEKELEISNVTERNKTEVKVRVIKSFLKTINFLRSDIRSAVSAKNEFMLKSIMHELKQTGKQINYGRLSKISEHVERLIIKNSAAVPWGDIEPFIGKLLDVLDIITEENKEILIGTADNNPKLT
ncbi:MAG: response regulator [Ignavibacteria bacterium]